MTQALNMALLGNNVNTTGQVSLTAGVSGVLPVANGGTGTSSGILPVANGGTGTTSLTANNVLLGNGTSAPQFVAPGTSGNVLTSNGTTWSSAAPTSSAPTTTQVLNATAGASVGAVGTYAFLGEISSAATAVGGTKAGSGLRFAGIAAGNWTSITNSPANFYPQGTTTAGVGTWRAMGRSYGNGCTGILGATVWLRIS